MGNIIDRFKRGIKRLVTGDMTMDYSLSAREQGDAAEINKMNPTMYTARSRGVPYYYVELPAGADVAHVHKLFIRNHIPMQLHTSRLGGIPHPVLRIGFSELGFLNMTGINFLEAATGSKVDEDFITAIKMRDGLPFTPSRSR